ncbi:MAG: hypothetical protein R3A48_15835 [Polyangiales bacterium]
MQRSGGGEQRARYVHVVSAAFSNADPANNARVLRRYDPRAPAGPTLLRDMERACRNALTQLEELPGGDASPVTHLFGITLPDRDFSVNALHGFYDFKSRLALGHRCQVRFEVGSSDAGAVLFASALRLLQGIEGPATALVVAGQEIAPDARRNVRDFVGQVIDARERGAGLNMIPLGDMIMDAVVHRASITAGGLPVLLRAGAIRGLLSLWTRRKLQYGCSYAPAQRGPMRPDAWNRAQGRWLGSQDMAAASVGACAVVLSTDPAVIARGAGGRIVRVLGVGEGDARPAVTEREEPLVFFKSMRQSLSALRRATGTNLDFLRASGFAVLHDAFPSIELALLASLGFSPADGAQRAAGWWPNPRGGLMATGHAFAASGLVQIAHATHTFACPSPFDADALTPQLASVVSSPRPVHCVTASVGGPLSHVVTTLLQSLPRAALDDLDAPFEPPPRHRAGTGDDDRFEEKAAWVAGVAGFYREALARVAPPGERLGVLEARTRLRLDSLVAALLPLPFTSRGDWAAPTRVEYLGRSWEIPEALTSRVYERMTSRPRESAATPMDGAADAPRRVFVSEDDRSLRAELVELVTASARVMVASAGEGLAAPPSVSELRDELLAALGVPVGFFATDASAAHPHELGLIAAPGVELDELTLGTVMTLRGSARGITAAVSAIPGLPGVVPPWHLNPAQGARGAAGYEALAPRIDALLAMLRAKPAGREAIVAARRLASDGAAIAVRSPTVTPPGDLIALLHALVMDPDEDRDALALALSRWRRSIPRPDAVDSLRPPASLEVAATCLVDVVGASGRSLSASVGQLQVVARAMRRAEAWLAGSRVEHARIADAFCLTAWLPPSADLDRATPWIGLLTFARDVYQHCLDHDVSARILVTAGGAMPFREVDATSLGAVSGAGFALEAALSRCLGPAFDQHFGAARRDGVIAVLPEPTVARIGGGAAGDDLAVASGFDAIWRLEGERLLPIEHRGDDPLARRRCGLLRCADGAYAYQFRQRP